MSSTVRIATYSADPPGCDSFHAQDPESFVLIPAVADSLAHVDIDGRIRPALATAWKRVDPVTMDFELRQNIRFHNGEPFDASSVVATLQAHIHPETRSFVGGSILSSIQECRALGPYSVRITTLMPDAMFLNRLALFSQIYPKSVLDRGPDALLRETVGTGAYRLESWTRGDQIVLRRNDGHWANTSTVDQLVYPIIPQNEWIDRLVAGDVDIAINVGAHDAARARKLPGLVTRERPGVVPYFFLLRNQGPLADPRVRRALNYALHKPLLAQVASNGSAVTQLAVAGPNGLGYAPDLARYYYDVELAKRLLEEAGWGKGFRVRGIVTEASAGLYSIVRELLRRIDVVLEAEIVPRGAWMMRVPVPRMSGGTPYDGDFTLAAFDDPISHTLFQHFMQLCDKGPFSSLSDESYNGRLFDALTTVDEAELEQKIRALEQFTSEQALLLLTTRESVFSIAREGFEIPLPLTGHFNYSCLWNLRAPADLPERPAIPRRAKSADPEIEKLIDATAFPGNLYLPGGRASLAEPALRGLYRNIELHEERWRQSSETMIRLLVDQAAAQTHLDNIARSTKQTGIVLLAPDGRVSFANDGYELVTHVPRATPLGAVLWSARGELCWNQIKDDADRTGGWAGVVSMGKDVATARQIFLTVTPALSELDTRAGYACTFTDYSKEEERLRLKAEADTAALVQKALLPPITDAHVSAYYRPASEVGGDWFYADDDGDRLTLLVGDVTGHGTAPALVTASVAGATAVMKLASARPEHVLSELDRVVERTGFGQYQMTLLYLQVERKSRHYRMSSAAHPYPIFRAGSNISRVRRKPSPLLGERSNDGWEVHEGTLDADSLVLLYTDGIIENMNPLRQAHGVGRLVRSIERLSPGDTCDHMLKSVVAEADRFYANARALDDITLMLARIQ